MKYISYLAPSGFLKNQLFFRNKLILEENIPFVSRHVYMVNPICKMQNTHENGLM